MDSAISFPQIILMGGWIVIYPVDSTIQRLNNWGLAPVVQTLDSAIHRINHYPADEYYGNQLRYPLDRDLSGG